MTLKAYILITCSLILCSCSDNPGSKKSILQHYPVNHFLPFGNPLLTQYKTFQRWSVPLDDDTTQKRDPQQIKYQSIIDSYYEYTQKKAIHAPEIKSIEHINMGKDSVTCRDKEHFYKDFKYRLPNIGLFECYYQSGSFYNRPSEKQALPNGCMDYGNIVLIFPKARKAKVLNVYYGQSGELIYLRRLFYINKDSSIDIYESSEFESETTVKKVFIVTINKTGKITIINK